MKIYQRRSWFAGVKPYWKLILVLSLSAVSVFAFATQAVSRTLPLVIEQELTQMAESGYVPQNESMDLIPVEGAVIPMREAEETAGDTENMTEDRHGSCTFVLSDTELMVDSSGGTGIVLVKADGSCAWGVPANLIPWVKLAKNSTEKGNGTITYTVMSNTAQSARTAAITVASKILLITQAGMGQRVATNSWFTGR